MKLAASRNLKRIVVVTVFLIFLSSEKSHAATLVTTNGSICSGAGMNTSRYLEIPIVVPSAATVRSVLLSVQAGYPSSNGIVAIYNSSGSSATTRIATFSYESESNLIGKFTGIAELPAAGTYVLRISATADFRPCFAYSTDITGSTNGWNVGYWRNSNDSGATYTQYTNGFMILFKLIGSGGGSINTSSLEISGPSNARYRVPSTLTATLGSEGSDGIVTFFANGKRISGCTSTRSISLTATCTWRPAVRGKVRVSATLTPTDITYPQARSRDLVVPVENRVALR